MSHRHPGVSSWRRLGEILVEEFALPAERLEAALAVQAVKGLRLGTTLVEMKALAAETLARALARQFELPFAATLADDQANTELLAELPIGFVKEYLVFPLALQEGRLRVAIADPLDFHPLNDLGTLTGAEGSK